ncbi:hypothetical protein R3P38DRAFT_2903696 [Favolaschia claudopus]|uniref:Uncharacterized protein n=1 Tax=Favolaschia claudopus TaxID=2862362 RepID=A0AAW0CFN2_9AGAR
MHMRRPREMQPAAQRPASSNFSTAISRAASSILDFPCFGPSESRRVLGSSSLWDWINNGCILCMDAIRKISRFPSRRHDGSLSQLHTSTAALTTISPLPILPLILRAHLCVARGCLGTRKTSFLRYVHRGNSARTVTEEKGAIHRNRLPLLKGGRWKKEKNLLPNQLHASRDGELWFGICLLWVLPLILDACQLTVHNPPGAQDSFEHLLIQRDLTCRPLRRTYPKIAQYRCFRYLQVQRHQLHTQAKDSSSPYLDDQPFKILPNKDSCAWFASQSSLVPT